MRWLETWWQGLGSRLATDRQVRITTANVPEAVASLAGQWWTLALDHARVHADEALAADRASLLDARETLERDRHTMQTEFARLKSLTHEAQQAEQLAAARASELDRLVEQLQYEKPTNWTLIGDGTGHRRQMNWMRVPEALDSAASTHFSDLA
ncbi:hypothetical protein EI541_21635, partial [Xanthomonas citri pv. eucalyptorum]|uniref:DNA-binding protein n=1 Tax=Xanthomonas citri TaxID=346 RepID=UPI000FD27DDB